MNKYIREPGNFYTHFVPFLCAIVGLYLLIDKSTDIWGFIAALIYGGGMVLLFASSAGYHAIPRSPKQIRLWQKLDHSSIYVMIAGSFTPTCLLVFRDRLGMTLLVLIWSFALVGIVLKIFNKLKKPRLSTLLYILMGCSIIPFVFQLAEKLSIEALIWLFMGGVFYIGGTYYYTKDKPLSKYVHSHEVWHIFVNLGAAAHFVYNYQYIF
jgi:hemolysin III